MTGQELVAGLVNGGLGTGIVGAVLSFGYLVVFTIATAIRTLVHGRKNPTSRR